MVFKNHQASCIWRHTLNVLLKIMSPHELTETQYDDLCEFVTETNRLKNSRFGRGIMTQEEISLRSGGGREPELVNFDEEDCRSFLLGCRMLMQNNDRISIGNIWRLFKDVINDSEWFVRVNPPRWMLNDYLDQDMLFQDPTGSISTNRELVDTFLYGAYAHLNRDHRRRFKEWQNNQHFHSLKLQFLLALQVILQMAGRMADAVDEYLNQEI